MSNQASKILVLGATGNVGGQVARLLAAQGHDVLAVSRNPEAQEAVSGLQWVRLDEANLDAVFTGVERAFIFSPPGVTDQYAYLAPYIEASVRHGLKKVVLMTANGVEAAPPEVPLRRAELALEASGVPYAILRPNWFMQNFNTFWIGGIQGRDAIEVPAGDSRSAFIDVRDIGAVAATLLLRDGTDGGLSLTGPEALTHDEAAAKLSAVAGRAIRYVDLDPEAFRQGLIGAGVGADYAGLLVGLYEGVRQGWAAGVTDVVKQVLGREPISLDQYAADHRAAFRQAATTQA